MMITEPPARLTDKLFMLGTCEYPLYLYKGERQAAIFEAATGHVGPLLMGQLEQFEIDPATVKQIVVPHAHPDHVMALPLMLKLFPYATLAASEVGAKTLSVEKAIALFCRLDDAISDAMAAAGKIPFASSFAKFLMRAADQIEMAAITNANIKLVGSHAGISLAADGPSQMGIADLAFFRALAHARAVERRL